MATAQNEALAQRESSQLTATPWTYGRARLPPTLHRRPVGDQQSRPARSGPRARAHPWQGRLRPHGRLVHPRCKCAPRRSVDPRTGTRSAQVPATNSRLTASGNRASAARTGLSAALHARYFQKSAISEPKSPPVRRSPLNVAEQCPLASVSINQAGSKLDGRGTRPAQTPKGGFVADTIYSRMIDFLVG